MRRVLALVVLVCGLAALVGGVVWASRLGPSGRWTATADVPAGSRAVLVDPSLASVRGPDATVSARRADGGALSVGTALPADARSYVGSAPVAVVSGRAGREQLVVRRSGGSAAVPVAEGLDLWRDLSTGRGERSTGTGQGPALSVVVTSADGAPLPATTVDVVWTNGRWFDLAIVSVLVGIVLLGLGTVLLLGRVPRLGALRALRSQPVDERSAS